MKEEHIKELFEKYKSGQTSLEEEQFLLKNSNELNFPLSNWIIFKKKNTKEVTENFNDKLWQSFEENTRPKKQIMKRVLVVAASIALLFTLYIKNQTERAQSLSEKKALLMEAKRMLSEAEQKPNQEIIFHNDLVNIYIKTE